jgi:hypothetical protein
MKNHAVPTAIVNSRLRWIPVFLLVAALPLVAPGEPTSAHKMVGRDGKLRACYVVKGKPKGALRLVRGRAKCRRGERKVAWTVSGPAAQTGATGAAGSPGADAATIAALSERVDALTARVEKLEGVVEAVCPQISLVTSLLPTESFSCPVP